MPAKWPYVYQKGPEMQTKSTQSKHQVAVHQGRQRLLAWLRNAFAVGVTSSCHAYEQFDTPTYLRRKICISGIEIMGTK